MLKVPTDFFYRHRILYVEILKITIFNSFIEFREKKGRTY